MTDVPKKTDVLKRLKNYLKDLPLHSDMRCCICGQPFVGYGNNPRPAKDTGRCCDVCNERFVIPERVKHIMKQAPGARK